MTKEEGFKDSAWGACRIYRAAVAEKIGPGFQPWAPVRKELPESAAEEGVLGYSRVDSTGRAFNIWCHFQWHQNRPGDRLSAVGEKKNRSNGSPSLDAPR